MTTTSGYVCDTVHWTIVEDGGSITITNTLRDDSPGTGDSTKTVLWSSMMFASAIGACGALWFARKKKKDPEE